MNSTPDTDQAELARENAGLKARLAEAEATLAALHAGQVDAVVVDTRTGPQLFGLTNAVALSTQLHGEMLAQVSDAVIALDAAGRITYVNAAAERQYGLPASEVLGQPLEALYRWSWPREAEEEAQRALRERGEWRGESRQCTCDGRVLHVEASVTRLRGSDGQPAGLLAVMRDITGRRAAEEQLQAHDRFLGELTQVIPGMLYLQDVVSGRNLYVNEASLPTLGHTPAEILAMPAEALADLVHPEDQAVVARHHAWLAGAPDGTPDEIEYRCRHKDGSWRWLQSREVVYRRDADGRVRQILGVAIDISARKAGERLLRENEERYRFLVESTTELVYQVALRRPLPVALPVEAQVDWVFREGYIGWANDSCARAYGYARAEEMVGTPLVRLMPRLPDHEAMVRKAVQAGYRMVEGRSEDQERSGRRKVLLNAFVGRVEGGHVLDFIGTSRDITARVEAEEALRESESRLRLALEAAATGLWDWDARTGQLALSPEAERRLGLAPGEFARTLSAYEQLIHPEDRAPVRAALERALAEGSRFRCEFRVVRPDRAVRWISALGRGLYGMHGRPLRMLGTLSDVTERKATEEELTRHREALEQLVQERTAELEASHARLRFAERMAAIGTLSAGLGHDMGNLLMPLRVRLQALARMELPDAADEELEGIRATAEYLRRLASGLKLLAVEPGASREAEPTPVGPWWADAEPVLRNALPRRFGFSADLTGCQDARVRMSRAGLTQAVFNLVQNAGDAMERQGEGWVTVTARPEGGRLILRVADTGPGMSDEVKRHCMEPFFTTKPRGISTGLGLALVYGLVKEAGGTMQLVSELGRGTAFSIALPLVPAEREKARACRRAFLDIADLRLRAYVTAELKRRRYEVLTGLGEVEPTDLVVVDGPREPAPGGTVVVLPRTTRFSAVRATLLGAVGPEEAQ
jgi:PAS domain S-box-containing protein